jgi:hypothetical protein
MWFGAGGVHEAADGNSLYREIDRPDIAFRAQELVADPLLLAYLAESPPHGGFPLPEVHESDQ